MLGFLLSELVFTAQNLLKLLVLTNIRDQEESRGLLFSMNYFVSLINNKYNNNWLVQDHASIIITFNE